LQTIYPDNAEVKELIDETQMRAIMARFQPWSQAKIAEQRNIRRLVISTLIVIILTVWGYIAYELWLNPILMQALNTP